ncbi:hypothetical protein BTVI_40977 [Pitangus sulphuratus]|nr:hypothetical protein BTVI_40977 [Pitangus sulphuratus]
MSTKLLYRTPLLNRTRGENNMKSLKATTVSLNLGRDPKSLDWASATRQAGVLGNSFWSSYLQHFKDPKGYWWAFGVATVIEEKSKQLFALSGLSEDPSVVELLPVKDQQVPIATATVHRPQFAFTWRGVQYTWNRLPQGWKHSPAICHGLIQATLEKAKAPEHIQYIDDIIVWGDTAKEVFIKGQKIIQILLKAGFALKNEEEEPVSRAEEAPPYNQLPDEETRYALFTDGSCPIVGRNRKWKVAVWSPTRQVAETTEDEGESSQFVKLKAVRLVLDIAEREGWPRLYLYTDSWMIVNVLWGWLDQWKKINWRRRGKPIWASDLWQDIAARVKKLNVRIRHVDGPRVELMRNMLITDSLLSISMPRVPFCLVALKPLCPTPEVLEGVVVAKMQDPALGLVESHTVGFSPSTQPVQVPLQSPPTLQHIDSPPQLGVIFKFANGRLHPLIQIINKDIKQDWDQH